VSIEAESRLVIRAARPDELVDVIGLWLESREMSPRSDDSAALGALLDRDRDALLVAEVDDRIVGSIIAVWDGWRGNLYRLTVHPAWRRRGIARRLVAAGEKRLHALDVRRISALVWTDDVRAVSVWRSAGYDYDEGMGRFVKTIAEAP
jgi:ribosomal protein S18 acetylase RimI-like enzyme